jgi:hypothetical protein
MAGMNPRIRMLVYVTAGALVISTGVGCGLLSAAKKIANNASVMSSYSEKLEKGTHATYKATYKDITGGDTVTVQQQPPNSVYVTKTGPWIFNGNTSYNCDNSSGSMVCTKTEYSSDSDANAALAGSSLATGGFFVGELGIGLILAAAVVPNSKLSQNKQTIAGQSSDCVTVSNLSDVQSAGDTELSSFTMCVTGAGVVSKFSGTDTSGKTEGSVMTAYTTSIDASLFQPPAGAQIVDTNSPPPASPEPSGT